MAEKLLRTGPTTSAAGSGGTTEMSWTRVGTTLQYLMTSQDFMSTRAGKGMSPVTTECVSAHLILGIQQHMDSRKVNTHRNILQNLGWARKTFSLIQITKRCVLVCLFERSIPVLWMDNMPPSIMKHLWLDANDHLCQRQNWACYLKVTWHFPPLPPKH